MRWWNFSLTLHKSSFTGKPHITHFNNIHETPLPHLEPEKWMRPWGRYELSGTVFLLSISGFFREKQYNPHNGSWQLRLLQILQLVGGQAREDIRQFEFFPCQVWAPERWLFLFVFTCSAYDWVAYHTLRSYFGRFDVGEEQEWAKRATTQK